MKNTRLLPVLCLVTALSCAFSQSGRAELVTNGGFETGDFTGWSHTGNTGATSVSSGYAHSGSFGAQLGPVGSDGLLTQTLATTSGEIYDISFWLRADGGSSDFSVSFGTDTLLSLVDSASFGYTVYNYSAAATGTSTTLQFAFRQDPAYWGLDDVSVTDSGRNQGVPDASNTLGLLGLALAGLVAAKRKFN